MASLLAEAKPIIPSDLDLKKKEGQQDPFWLALRTSLNTRLIALETFRYGWWQHWARLAEYILPRRYHWVIVANRTDRGMPINGNIIDATGTIAARTLAAGLMSGLTSPTRPWFRLAVGNQRIMEMQSVKIWCDEVQRRMLIIMAKSNFYDSLAAMYFDLVVFGTAPVIIYEDEDTVIRCYNPCAGEYYLGADGALRINSLYRKFTLTLNQIVDMFGKAALSASMSADYERGGAPLEREYIIAHAIEPNRPVVTKEGKEKMLLPKVFTFREVYWIYGGENPAPLAIRGFKEDPFLAPRWDITSNEAYGRSPCMDALPDIMQLQQETKRKAEAIEKQVRPPLLADVSLKNQPTSSVAGGITYVASLTGAVGMKPVYEVKPDLSGMMEDLKEIQARIKNILFNDLFMMISQLDTVRSATEIDARREEKLIQLGPVIERLQGEGLDTAIERVFAIMDRKGLLPPPPVEIQGKEIQIQYISMLAEAQRAIGTAGIERLFQFAGNMAGVNPEIMDNLDGDEAIAEYGDLLHVPAKLVKDKKVVAKVRAARNKQQQQAALLQQTVAGAKGAKDLSETQVGGGKNALEMMLNTGGGGGMQ